MTDRLNYTEQILGAYSNLRGSVKDRSTFNLNVPTWSVDYEYQCLQIKRFKVYKS